MISPKKLRLYQYVTKKQKTNTKTNNNGYGVYIYSICDDGLHSLTFHIFSEYRQMESLHITSNLQANNSRLSDLFDRINLVSVQQK